MLHKKTTRSRPGRGQSFEAEVEAKSLRPMPRPKFGPRGHFGLEDFTSLVRSRFFCFYFLSICWTIFFVL